MGKLTGFLDYERQEDSQLSVESRIKNFNEFYTPLDEEARREQGARCMNCGVPLCQSALRLNGMVTGCPLHNLIPEWNDGIYNGNFEHALLRLLKTNNFPEFTSRVCPALCEKACICGLNGDPVTVHNNEHFLIEKGFEQGLVKPRIPKIRSDRKIAVIGSGPAGLAVADRLNRRGHNVTVFERDDRIGGLLMYGIPNMKIEKNIIDRRRKLMEEEGVVFKTGINIGKDISAKEILDKFDAVALCCGAKQPRGLNVKGIDSTAGIYYAVDFLTSTTKSLLDNELKKGTFISAKGKNVVIVGGGDTGNDCVGTCIRHGCKSVVQLEMLPEPPENRLESNPWPEWPKVKKTDYGQKEAIAVFGSDPRIYETTVKELIAEKGVLKAIKTVKTKFVNNALTEVKGTEQTIPCELLLIAAGFTGCENYVPKEFGVDLSPRGTVFTKKGLHDTNVPKVYTAGDMRKGQSLVVWAIRDGRRCAREIDCYLMGYTNME